MNIEIPRDITPDMGQIKEVNKPPELGGFVGMEWFLYDNKNPEACAYIPNLALRTNNGEEYSFDLSSSIKSHLDPQVARLQSLLSAPAKKEGMNTLRSEARRKLAEMIEQTFQLPPGMVDLDRVESFRIGPILHGRKNGATVPVDRQWPARQRFDAVNAGWLATKRAEGGRPTMTKLSSVSSIALDQQAPEGDIDSNNQRTTRGKRRQLPKRLAALVGTVTAMAAMTLAPDAKAQEPITQSAVPGVYTLYEYSNGGQAQCSTVLIRQQPASNNMINVKGFTAKHCTEPINGQPITTVWLIKNGANIEVMGARFVPHQMEDIALVDLNLDRSKLPAGSLDVATPDYNGVAEGQYVFVTGAPIGYGGPLTFGADNSLRIGWKGGKIFATNRRYPPFNLTEAQMGGVSGGAVHTQWYGGEVVGIVRGVEANNPNYIGLVDTFVGVKLIPPEGPGWNINGAVQIDTYLPDMN